MTTRLIMLMTMGRDWFNHLDSHRHPFERRELAALAFAAGYEAAAKAKARPPRNDLDYNPVAEQDIA